MRIVEDLGGGWRVERLRAAGRWFAWLWLDGELVAELRGPLRRPRGFASAPSDFACASE